ncbi:MAG: Perosamine synthetase [uncultured bacterium]|nr:MAG: Perosamine synthetase [uncultured bacterium]OGT25457.1 MAG: glutamine--scyllo-inositol aminotransferase [Gammaproteobacteria bacterium RIFCSPHIGHO2_02_FULL_42_43]OGT27524.1 MAG: glutamine--scyllo-inositol aminotransferase [Gammaproteobacteria bacterium RIFCSPHIGHO2_01_FULL_42_8]OGT51408.1 MAG: glutamine--scyllo-inositol aminotransferase [Gammaproteobacteria bacterium RIFCSPHIGHO2_12_FULL_41_25]OGT85782.1 MAG: glutamine--scyllo-inositol aminotransferase [Gammaproteobacteria bacterium RIF
MKSRIYYTKPSITDLEVSYATDAAKFGWGDRCYDYIYRFENEFKVYLNSKFAIATSSCTGALHIGLSALDIKPGDEVILADTNWIATVAPIVQLGATPVFVDILSDTWCINPKLAEAAITPKTKAIIVTHLYGNLCDMKTMLEIGKRHNIFIIEDAAEALGSQLRNEKAGSMGIFGIFSFHGTKTLTTGEGGMFVTNNAALYEKVLTLSNHGRSRNQTKQFWPDTIGFKYKMSNIQAAIGCAQIKRIHELINRKREILSYYKQNLKNISCISMNPEPTGTVNSAWMPTIVFDKNLCITQENLQSAFKNGNVDARVFFHPLSSLPMFSSHPKNPLALDISKRAINLPSYHDMTRSEQDRIIEIIQSLLINVCNF